MVVVVVVVVVVVEVVVRGIVVVVVVVVGRAVVVVCSATDVASLVVSVRAGCVAEGATVVEVAVLAAAALRTGAEVELFAVDDCCLLLALGVVVSAAAAAVDTLSDLPPEEVSTTAASAAAPSASTTPAPMSALRRRLFRVGPPLTGGDPGGAGLPCESIGPVDAEASRSTVAVGTVNAGAGAVRMMVAEDSFPLPVGAATV